MNIPKKKLVVNSLGSNVMGKYPTGPPIYTFCMIAIKPLPKSKPATVPITPIINASVTNILMTSGPVKPIAFKIAMSFIY